MPDRVPPEIETLRANPHHAFHRAHDGEAVRSYVMIPLSDAEAAVRACEQRLKSERPSVEALLSDEAVGAFIGSPHSGDDSGNEYEATFPNTAHNRAVVRRRLRAALNHAIKEGNDRT